MKNKNLLLIAAVGVVAYVLFMRSKKSGTPAAAASPMAIANAKPLAPTTRELRLGANEAI
jgi:hypothetical protein